MDLGSFYYFGHELVTCARSPRNRQYILIKLYEERYMLWFPQ